MPPDQLLLRSTDLDRTDWPPVCVLTGSGEEVEVVPLTVRSVPRYVLVFAFVPILFLPAYLLLLRTQVVHLPVRRDRAERLRTIQAARTWLFLALIGVAPAGVLVVLLTFGSLSLGTAIFMTAIMVLPLFLVFGVLSTVLHYICRPVTALRREGDNLVLQIPSVSAATSLARL